MECKTRQGFTPLINAAQQGQLPVVKLLIERGARLNATQREGARAIHMASQDNRHEVVRYLVQEAGENVDVVSTILPLFLHSLIIITFLKLCCFLNETSQSQEGQINTI